MPEAAAKKVAFVTGASRGIGEAIVRRFAADGMAVAFDIIDVLRRVAEKHDATPAQIALAWLLSRPVVDSVIVGAKRVDQLTDNIGAIDVALDPEDLAALDEVSVEAPRYPHWMLTYNVGSRFPKGHPVTGPSWVGGETPLRAE